MTIKGDASNIAQIMQEDSYYPFGLKLPSMSIINGTENKYTYNGKELVDDFGLNWYHYGARYYDPTLGRWHSIDPADEFYSPYVYCANNPEMLMDPDGCTTECVDGQVTNVIYDGSLQLINNDEVIGTTIMWNSFIDQATGNPAGFVNVGSNKNENILLGFTNDVVNHKVSLENYLLNAGNGQEFDIKTNENSKYGMVPVSIFKNYDKNYKYIDMYTGSMIDSKNKVYGTLKDTGNIMAGFIAGYNGLSEKNTLRATGSYNYGNNSLINGIWNFMWRTTKPPYYGEYPQSSIMQRYGWRLGNDSRK